MHPPGGPGEDGALMRDKRFPYGGRVILHCYRRQWLEVVEGVAASVDLDPNSEGERARRWVDSPPSASLSNSSISHLPNYREPS